MPAPESLQVAVRKAKSEALADAPQQLFGTSSWRPIDLDPVLKGEITAPTPNVLHRDDGAALLYPGRLNAIFGEKESMKTFFAVVAIAQELAAGNTVLVIDFEDQAETWVERLRQLGVDDEAISEHLAYVDHPTEPFDELPQELVLLRGTPSLVIIDGVTEAMDCLGLNPDKGTDVAAFYGSYPRFLARTGAAVTVIDHQAKDRESRGRWAIGSERKLSGLDGAGLMVESVEEFGRGRTGRSLILIAKDRVGHLRAHQDERKRIAELVLVSNGEDGTISACLNPPREGVKAERWRPTGVMESVSSALADSSEPLTCRALRARVGGKARTVDTALELLIAEGHIVTRPGPRNSVLHQLVKPFRRGANEVEQ
jgi:hypothetical protein